MKLPKAEQDLEEWQTAVEAGRRSQRPDHDGAHRYDEGAQSAGGRFVTLGLTRDISCNEGIAAVPADSLVEGDRCMAIAAAIRATAARVGIIIRRFMGSLPFSSDTYKSLHPF
jgi:hypothetical protein